jgi:ubiquinone/menaquinone biosynthesis C-methylase UbiE
MMYKGFFLPVLFLAAGLFVPPPAARPQAVETAPPALKEYKGRRIATTMHWKGADWLIRKKREREEASSLMLKQLNLKPGQVVCDLGCGNGYHTLRMARQVAPGGKVYAVDIQQEMLDLLAQRTERQDIYNIEPVLGSATSPQLPHNAMDLILLVDVYHEFSHPEHMLREIRSSLKPAGRLVLVEYRAEDSEVPIKKDHKMSKAQILKELKPNGFVLVREFDELPWQHMMFFETAGKENP